MRWWILSILLACTALAKAEYETYATLEEVNKWRENNETVVLAFSKKIDDACKLLGDKMQTLEERIQGNIDEDPRGNGILVKFRQLDIDDVANQEFARKFFYNINHNLPSIYIFVGKKEGIFYDGNAKHTWELSNYILSLNHGSKVKVYTSHKAVLDLLADSLPAMLVRVNKPGDRNEIVELVGNEIDYHIEVAYITKEVANKIGLPNHDIFIYHKDTMDKTEYTSRKDIPKTYAEMKIWIRYARLPSICSTRGYSASSEVDLAGNQMSIIYYFDARSDIPALSWLAALAEELRGRYIFVGVDVFSHLSEDIFIRIGFDPQGRTKLPALVLHNKIADSTFRFEGESIDRESLLEWIESVTKTLNLPQTLKTQELPTDYAIDYTKTYVGSVFNEMVLNNNRKKHTIVLFYDPRDMRTQELLGEYKALSAEYGEFNDQNLVFAMIDAISNTVEDEILHPYNLPIIRFYKYTQKKFIRSEIVGDVTIEGIKKMLDKNLGVYTTKTEL